MQKCRWSERGQHFRELESREMYINCVCLCATKWFQFFVVLLTVGWVGWSFCYLFLDSFFYFSGAHNSFEYIIRNLYSVTVQRKKVRQPIFFLFYFSEWNKIDGLRSNASLRAYYHFHFTFQERQKVYTYVRNSRTKKKCSLFQRPMINNFSADNLF